jgi:hypothetical protein
MRTWGLCLAVFAWLFMTPAAFAERNLGRYHKPDAGIVVISYSTTDSQDVGSLIERTDYNGSVQIISKPQPGAHDFTEQFDSGAYIRATGLTGYDNDKTDYYGKVEIIRLPPGKYYFWRPQKRWPPPPAGHDEPQLAEFSVETGRVTYVGSFRYVDLRGRNRLGFNSLLFYAVQHVNMAERDLAIAKSVGINVENPIIIGPDAPAAK